MIKDEKYYNSLDKRTTEFKEWNAKQSVKVEGLGDKVAKITKATGIKKVVEKITEDCGCGKRKETLNKYSKEFLALFVSRRKPIRCLTPDMYSRYGEFIKTRTLNLWKNDDVNLLIELYAHVFATAYKNTDLCRNCSGAGKILFRITEELDRVYKAYEA